MGRWVTALLLMSLALGVIRVSLDGSVEAWVRTPLWVLILVACALATMSIVVVISQGQVPVRATAWALGLIVLTVAVMTPAALRPAQVINANESAATGSGLPSSWPDLPREATEVTVREVVARSAVPADPRMKSREVIITGQLDTEDGVTRLGRISITCCVADARAYFVELVDTGSHLRDVAPQGWVKARVALIPGSGTPARDFVPRVGLIEISEIDDQGYDVVDLSYRTAYTPSYS